MQRFGEGVRIFGTTSSKRIASSPERCDRRGLRGKHGFNWCCHLVVCRGTSRRQRVELSDSDRVTQGLCPGVTVASRLARDEADCVVSPSVTPPTTAFYLPTTLVNLSYISWNVLSVFPAIPLSMFTQTFFFYRSRKRGVKCWP